MTIQEQIAIADGSRFQKEWAQFIADKKELKTIVETGCGVSSIFILKALDGYALERKLYSIDPQPWYPYQIEHPRFELIKKKSMDALLDLYKRTGAWDVFCHDSEHEIKNMTYEYEFAFGCLNGGGYIASDDYTFGNNQSWQNFLARHDLKPIKMGSIEYAQKPKYMSPWDNIEEHHRQCVELAENAEKMWFEAGNKNSDVMWYQV